MDFLCFKDKTVQNINEYVGATPVDQLIVHVQKKQENVLVGCFAYFACLLSLIDVSVLHHRKTLLQLEVKSHKLPDLTQSHVVRLPVQLLNLTDKITRPTTCFELNGQMRCWPLYYSSTT